MPPLLARMMREGAHGMLGIPLTNADYLNAWTKLVESGAITGVAMDDAVSDRSGYSLSMILGNQR